MKGKRSQQQGFMLHNLTEQAWGALDFIPSKSFIKTGKQAPQGQFEVGAPETQGNSEWGVYELLPEDTICDMSSLLVSRLVSKADQWFCHGFAKNQYDAISPFCYPSFLTRLTITENTFFFKLLEAKSQNLILNAYSKAFFPSPVRFTSRTVFPSVFWQLYFCF